MRLDSLVPYHGHNLPGVLAALIGVGLVALAFKAQTRSLRLLLVLVAAALFAGAGWWVTHIRS